MPRPPSTLQHLSFIDLTIELGGGGGWDGAILSILMCNFLSQFTSSFVIALGF